MKNRIVPGVVVVAGLLAMEMASASQVRNVGDLNALKAQATQSKKLVAIFVTSSDPSCLDCSRMRKDFFRDPAFTDWINRFSVFGEIDANERGRGKAEVDAAKAAARAAQAPFVPTMVLLDPNGGIIEYQTANHVPSQTASLFHEIYLQRVVGVSQPGSATVSLGPDNRTASKNNATAPAPGWNPPNAVPVRYDELKLRSISGKGARQFVLINDQTLGVGERARVTLNGKRVFVKCLEIRAGQAVVEVEGEAKPRLLVLETSRPKATAAR